MSRYGKLNLRAGGPPDVIHKAGSTRYKFDQAVWVEEIWDVNAYTAKFGSTDFKEGKFYAYQAGPSGRRAKLLGVGDTLEEAEAIASRKAEKVL